jgi:hypothetical protein
MTDIPEKHSAEWPHWDEKTPCPDCNEPYGPEQILLVDPHGPTSRWVCNRCGTG